MLVHSFHRNYYNCIQCYLMIYYEISLQYYENCLLCLTKLKWGLNDMAMLCYAIRFEHKRLHIHVMICYGMIWRLRIYESPMLRFEISLLCFAMVYVVKHTHVCLNWLYIEQWLVPFVCYMNCIPSLYRHVQINLPAWLHVNFIFIFKCFW